MQLEESATESKKGAMPFSEIRVLSLSFRNICRIENLTGLIRLTTLKLDNNCISTIENLEHLTSLQWLDLSFNRIRIIEGLDSLTNLTDLSLFSNEIETIGSGLDNLSKLNVLSLGDNKIASFSEVKRLRKFKKLRLVILTGNPISRSSDYRKFVLAHLDNLKYFDHRLVSESDVDAARIDFQESREHLEKQDEEELELQRENTEKEKCQKQLYDANIDGIEKLHERMIAKDEEQSKLASVPGLTDGLSELNEKFDQRTDSVRAAVLEQHQKKVDEEDEWSKVVRATGEERDEQAQQLIIDFRRRIRREARRVQNGEAHADDSREKLSSQNDELKDALLEIETDAVDVVSQQVKEFQVNYTDLTLGQESLMKSSFAELRELENEYYEILTKNGQSLLEKYGKGQLEEELAQLDDSVRSTTEALLSDKDSLMELIQRSHDSRTAVIDRLEDSFVSEKRRRADKLVSEARDWSEQRNRRRVSEIHALHERLRTELDAVGIGAVDDDSEVENEGGDEEGGGGGERAGRI